jgi:hypothetical protein
MCHSHVEVSLHFCALYDRQYLPLLSMQLPCAPGRDVPQHSAHIQNKPNGAYDFMAHPIASAGIRVAIHEKPEVRQTWPPHALDGLYVGPAREHNISYNVWLPGSNRVLVFDALAWFPDNSFMPCLSPIDLLSTAIKDFSTLLSSLRYQDQQPAQLSSPSTPCRPASF